MNKRFYLYIDDSGSRFPDKKQLKRHDGMDHFALGGVLIEENDKKLIEQKYLTFCEKWGIEYPLHSTKIRGMRDDFLWMEGSSKNKDKFLEELSDFLLDIPVIGFAAVIDRPGYNERYKEKYGDKRWWMCKTTYSIVIERVTKYVLEQGGTVEVRFEGTGPKEDSAIIQYAKDLKTIGSPFSADSSEKYSALTPDEYKKVLIGEPRRKTKNNLYIQIADLFLYPMVKRKYDENYLAWKMLFENKKVIDSFLAKEEYAQKGIKYSCFDYPENKKPE